MKFRRLNLFFCFIILIFLVGCGKELSLKEKIVQIKIPVIKGESIDVEELFNPFMTKESLDKGSLNHELSGKYHDLRILTTEKMYEDIDILFERLRATYGGYIAFGGEVKFEEVKKNILREVGTRDISSMDFKYIIKKNLNFINDAHFLIENERLREFKNTKVALDMEIEKHKNNYRLKDNHLSINLKDLERFIKPSIDDNGDFVYKLFYKEMGEDSVPDLNWKSISNINHRDNIEPEYKEIDNIPILKIKQFYHTANYKDYYDFVIENAKNLSNYDYSILDLRGNGGGNAILVNKLLNSYSGESGRISGDIMFYVNLEESKTDGTGQSTEDILDYIDAMGMEKYDDNHYFGRGSDETFEQEGILFVLIDGGSGSASEHTIDILKHFDNTIFVGVPSMGMMTSSSSSETVLPNSKMTFYWGNLYINLNPSYFKEFYGFEPDIWIEPEYAEENLLKLIRNIRNGS